jgi:iron-sulfur cluster repair protein YtfE (RIC family)
MDRPAGGPRARDPIERLLDEHASIMRQFDALRGAAERLARAGGAALPGELPVLQATVRMIESELLRHARREDEALFPAVEAVLEGGPTPVMREEHRAIHAEADRFRATLRELHEVQHPAIVQAGERLSALTERGSDAAALVRTARTLLELVDDHFAKEEQLLFPMARELLTREALDAVSRGMEAIDRSPQVER